MAILDAKMRRASKTPPPSPVDESIDKGTHLYYALKFFSSLKFLYTKINTLLYYTITVNVLIDEVRALYAVCY